MPQNGYLDKYEHESSKMVPNAWMPKNQPWKGLLIPALNMKPIKHELTLNTLIVWRAIRIFCFNKLFIIWRCLGKFEQRWLTLKMMKIAPLMPSCTNFEKPWRGSTDKVFMVFIKCKRRHSYTTIVPQDTGDTNISQLAANSIKAFCPPT